MPKNRDGNSANATAKVTARENLQVFMDMKNFFELMGLPVTDEVKEERFQHFTSEIKAGGYSMHILAVFDAEEYTVVVTVYLSNSVPRKRIKTVIELLNLINKYLQIDHFSVCPHSGNLTIRGGLFVSKKGLDTEQFNLLFKRLVNDARAYFPAIIEQVNSQLKPKKLLTRFLKEREQYWK